MLNKYKLEDDKSYYDYDDLLNGFGVSMPVVVEDHDYQGDTRVLFKDHTGYGYLIFGWGSCSGCDALQAASSIEEYQEILDGMVNDTKWFYSREEALDYFKTYDWEGNCYSYHSSETKDFVDQVIEYLENGG